MMLPKQKNEPGFEKKKRVKTVEGIVKINNKFLDFLLFEYI